MKHEEAIEEAIETMKCAKAEVEWDCPLDYAIAFDMAIDALEKQIPKKPASTSKRTLVDETDIAIYETRTFYDCPTCNERLCYRQDGYCGNCGQKLLWDEGE